MNLFLLMIIFALLKGGFERLFKNQSQAFFPELMGLISGKCQNINQIYYFTRVTI
jgi:hypothetical protein